MEQRKDSKIRPSKEESREKIPGLGGQRRARKISKDAHCSYIFQDLGTFFTV
jgi:hypothetical protein